MDFIHHGGVLLEIGLILIVGYLFGNLANFFNLPRVSGYILAGIIMSPSLLNIIDQEFLNKSNIITHASLSIITFLIGSSLSWDKVRSLGKSIAFITLGEAELAFLFVTLAMFLYFFLTQSIDIKMLIALSLLFGALASPTDPTATLAVIHEYRAKGVLTTTVLGVAALDDATGIMNFVLGYAIATSLVAGQGISIPHIVYEIVYQVAGAVILGIIMGYLMHFLGQFAEERKEVVTVTVGILFITFSLAHGLGVDELLATMTTGITLVNVDTENEKFRSPLENYIEDVIFTAFFVVGSAFLNLKILLQYLPIVIVYVLTRFAGKYTGVYIGGHISNAPDKVKKYLAFSLFPQGGIVIGLSLLAYQNPEFRDVGLILVNIVIGATAIHEFLGPVFSEIALKKAGEIEKKG
ncbi:MAG TPA: sodium:proton antiporter [Persephonella sp.]|uniref:Sodium/hydrogen exchanger n=1 Tax=Persephonella marina (strain DSM 14350 / EX-H1) TaxID=123214 RepID=C0QS21_PERMH|nr:MULTISPECIES: cation:proton antiporter [Persephonella]ACO03262.1 sodium/hydrogen exchanger [Persephonella marina EX-H1]HCB69212.1 sodium:proton antiporter [Persephonella sp.]